MTINLNKDISKIFSTKHYILIQVGFITSQIGLKWLYNLYSIRLLLDPRFDTKQSSISSFFLNLYDLMSILIITLVFAIYHVES